MNSYERDKEVQNDRGRSPRRNDSHDLHAVALHHFANVYLQRSGLQTPDNPEACSVLEPHAAATERRPHTVPGTCPENGGVFLYSAYDLCTIAAQLHRKKIIGQLKNVPTITSKVPQP